MPSSTVSHYRVLNKLGAGGMGEVYLAEDVVLGRKVALKLVRADALASPTARERLIVEARAAARLDHPNICSIYEAGEYDGMPFIAMQFVEGETLAARLRRQPIGLGEALEVAARIAHALAEAHAGRIVHRDVKPQNVILTPNGQVKVLDFGLAQVLRETRASLEEATTLNRLTEPGTLPGTLAYMSPEQVRGEPLDGRSDIFSLGVVLCEMVTGKHPFAARTAAETAAAILTREPGPLIHSVAGASSELERVVAKVLRKNRDERYQSAKDLALDLTALRQERPPGTVARPSQRRGPQRLLRPAVAAALALALLSGVWIAPKKWILGGPSRSGVLIRSLAVLPLGNLSAHPEQDYFADGMTEALITELAKIGALRVISRTSVMRYKNTTKPLPEIARELAVDALIEGSVLRSGERVRINAQLVRGPTDEHVWAESYERDVGDILSLQREVARAIALEIRVKVTPEEQARLTASAPTDPATHELYLKGRYHYNQAMETLKPKQVIEMLGKSVESLQAAVQRAPEFAPAHATLSLVYDSLAMRGDESALPKAKAAALRALEIDDGQTEAHAGLARTRLFMDWDWENAERHYRRALALNANLVDAHRRYAELLGLSGRFSEAITEMGLAVRLDPLRIVLKSGLANIYLLAGQYDRAIAQCHELRKLDPENFAMPFLLGRSLALMGRYDEALPELRLAVEAHHGDPVVQAQIAWVHAVSGQEAEARRILGTLREAATPPVVNLAVVHAALGQQDEAFNLLEQAYGRHDPGLLYVPTAPELRALRADPRYADLVRRVGFPQRAQR